MLIEKKFAVYYREIPLSLEHFMLKDGNMKFNKDGARPFHDGHRCPRLSIVMEPTGNANLDKDRVKRFEDLLQQLESNNQIVGYSG